MEMFEGNRKNRILVLGASGLTGGAIASTLDRGPADIEVVRAARKKEQVEAWKREGKQAVYLDLDDARTFPAALEGIDRLFLLTGYTIAMLHQSKTLVDAAADSGVSFIVHQGIFGNGRSTDPHFAWHEMVERYIEGSGVAWAHLHPEGGTPAIDGHLTNYVGTPNRYGLPAFYELHVWAWEHNPNGNFADWNTTVSCDKQAAQ